MVRSVGVLALAGGALAGGALAHTTAVSNLFLPGFEGQGLVGRILSADATATEYLVQCDPNAADKSFCGVGGGATVTMKPETYNFNIADGEHFTLEEQCIITDSTASCTWSADGEGAQATGVTTSVMTAIASSDFFIPVTVTGGWGALETGAVELRKRQSLDQCLSSGAAITETTFPNPTGKPETGTASTGPQSTTKPNAGAVQRPAAGMAGAALGIAAWVMA